MTKRDFTKWYKSLLQDEKEGYYGTEEIIDELWDYISQLNEEVKKYRRKKIK